MLIEWQQKFELFVKKVIQLIGIDRWYHAGLVCQILNVKGLPAELEK